MCFGRSELLKVSLSAQEHFRAPTAYFEKKMKPFSSLLRKLAFRAPKCSLDAQVPFNAPATDFGEKMKPYLEQITIYKPTSENRSLSISH